MKNGNKLGQKPASPPLKISLFTAQNPQIWALLKKISKKINILKKDLNSEEWTFWPNLPGMQKYA